MTDNLGNSGRKNGRPAKGDPPRVPYEELDRILVFGEVVTCEDGESKTVHYPSYRDLARRYGVCNSLIARYSRKYDCLRRREQARARIAVETDKKLVDLRATAIAMSRDDELRIIDTYLAGFESAMAEGRVRFDNPSDFNTMVRLKEFIQGGADSRQEIHAALSLDDLQARHRRMLKTVEASSSAERGETDDRVLAAPISGLQPRGSNSPAIPSATAAGEVTGDSALTGMVTVAGASRLSPRVAPCAAAGKAWDHVTRSSTRPRHRAQPLRPRRASGIAAVTKMAMIGTSDNHAGAGFGNRRELRKVAVEQGMNVGCTKSGVWKTRRYGVWWWVVVVVFGVANGRFPDLFQAGWRSNFRSINKHMDMFPVLFWSAVFLRN